MTSGPRLRFAPSPTGSLHVGNARTALVNWLVARRRGGRFVLRIEDTDSERNVAGAEAAIRNDLHWLGLEWDEGPDRDGGFGPYRQSAKSDRYAEIVERLLAGGAAYRCFCSSGELERQRAEARAAGRTYRYPGTCRELDRETVERRMAEGQVGSVRFRVPEEDVFFEDGLRGRTGLVAGSYGDFVIVRPDGRPTYQLAVVVDDHDMRIDEVVRGEDHLTNTPKQLQIYGALGWQPPSFTHLPLLLGPDRSRLSKRHGATTVARLREAGILAAALVNYLALLGWEPPDGEEVLEPSRLPEIFEIASLSAGNAVFDPDKLGWLNQQHIARLPDEAVLQAAEPFLREVGIHPAAAGPARGWWAAAVRLVVPRTRRIAELPSALELLWTAPDGDAAVAAHEAYRAAPELLDGFVRAAASGELDTDTGFRDAARRLGRETDRRGREIFHPLRVALTGFDDGPELAALVPLLQEGSRLDLEPPVLGVAERLARAAER